MRGVYILHFSKEYVGEDAHKYGDSFHYVGSAGEVVERVRRHKKGLGSQKTKRALEQGIEFQVTSLSAVHILETESLVTKDVTKYCSICKIRLQDSSDDSDATALQPTRNLPSAK